MVTKLSEWNGWTIDLKLRQFRKVELKDNGGPNMVFVPFNSEKGKEIFHEYCQEQYDYHMEEGSSYQRIQFDLEDKSFDSEDADILAQEMFNGAK